MSPRQTQEEVENLSEPPHSYQRLKRNMSTPNETAPSFEDENLEEESHRDTHRDLSDVEMFDILRGAMNELHEQDHSPVEGNPYIESLQSHHHATASDHVAVSPGTNNQNTLFHEYNTVPPPKTNRLPGHDAREPHARVQSRQESREHDDMIYKTIHSNNGQFDHLLPYHSVERPTTVFQPDLACESQSTTKQSSIPTTQSGVCESRVGAVSPLIVPPGHALGQYFQVIAKREVPVEAHPELKPLFTVIPGLDLDFEKCMTICRQMVYDPLAERIVETRHAQHLVRLKELRLVLHQAIARKLGITLDGSPHANEMLTACLIALYAKAKVEVQVAAKFPRPFAPMPGTKSPVEDQLTYLVLTTKLLDRDVLLRKTAPGREEHKHACCTLTAHKWQLEIHQHWIDVLSGKKRVEQDQSGSIQGPLNKKHRRNVSAQSLEGGNEGGLVPKRRPGRPPGAKNKVSPEDNAAATSITTTASGDTANFGDSNSMMRAHAAQESPSRLPGTSNTQSRQDKKTRSNNVRQDVKKPRYRLPASQAQILQNAGAAMQAQYQQRINALSQQAQSQPPHPNQFQQPRPSQPLAPGFVMQPFLQEQQAASRGQQIVQTTPGQSAIVDAFAAQQARQLSHFENSPPEILPQLFHHESRVTDNIRSAEANQKPTE